jgi:putative phosphoesterase
MDKILIFSDLHGDPHALDVLLEQTEREGVDSILCAGDWGLERLDSHRERLRMLSGTFRTVRGNCDSPWVFPDYGFALPPRYLVVDIGGRTLFLTHGDIYHDWRSSPVKLHNRDIFVTGHTHIARLSKFSDGPLLLNPGSASLPRDGRPPSYAVVTDREIVLKELFTQRMMDKLLI